MRPIALLTTLLLVLAGCGGSTDGVDVTDGGAGGGSTAATPPDGTWVLVESTPDVGVPADARATLRLEVTEGRTMSAGGDTPCNGFGGTATSTGAGGWEWRLDAVTEMGCEPDRTDAQDAYLDALAETDTWAFGPDGDLLLTGDDVELRFARQEPVDAAGLTGTDWILTGFVEGDAISSPGWVDPVGDAILRLDGDPDDGGEFVLFSGCRDFSGEWAADGDTIRWPSWGQSPESRDVEDCNDSELESERMVLAAVEGGFTTELRTEDVGSFLTIRSANDASIGLAFRGPQDGDDPRPDDEPTAAPTDDPDPEALAFTGPRDGEECYAVMAMMDSGGGAPTADAAMEELVTTGAGWWDPPPGVTHVGTTIVYEGRAVGLGDLFEFSDGTWAISGITVCYPPGSPLAQD